METFLCVRECRSDNSREIVLVLTTGGNLQEVMRGYIDDMMRNVLKVTVILSSLLNPQKGITFPRMTPPPFSLRRNQCICLYQDEDFLQIRDAKPPNIFFFFMNMAFAQ